MKSIQSKILTLKLTTALALFLALPIWAQANDHNNRGDRQQHFQKMVEELNLTESQQEQLKKLHEERKSNRDAHQQDRQKMSDLKKKLKTGLQSDSSETDLRVMHEELLSMTSKHKKERFEHLLKIRSILTPEQRLKFKGFEKMGRPHKKGDNFKKHEN